MRRFWDPDVRVLVFAGEGRAFSAGADIREFGSAESLHAAREARRQRDLWALLEALPKPTIAALHGVCYGAGIELPLYCDLRIAAEDARIALPEVTLGYIPSAGATQLAPRIAGPAPAARLIFSGLPIDAEQALQWGIVHEIVPARRARRRGDGRRRPPRRGRSGRHFRRQAGHPRRSRPAARRGDRRRCVRRSALAGVTNAARH